MSIIEGAAKKPKNRFARFQGNDDSYESEHGGYMKYSSCPPPVACLTSLDDLEERITRYSISVQKSAGLSDVH